MLAVGLITEGIVVVEVVEEVRFEPDVALIFTEVAPVVLISEFVVMVDIVVVVNQLNVELLFDPLVLSVVILSEYVVVEEYEGKVVFEPDVALV